MKQVYNHCFNNSHTVYRPTVNFILSLTANYLRRVPDLYSPLSTTIYLHGILHNKRKHADTHATGVHYLLRYLFLFLCFVSGAACFFVKHVQTGMCIYATSKIQVDAIWGKLFAVELSNNCLDPAAQFRFLDNSAMFNLERKSCFEGKSSVLYFLLAIDPAGNCRDRDHAIAQTSWGGLSVYEVDSGQTPCAVPTTNTYIGLTTCSDAEDKRFNFGKLFLFVCS